jgi:hypothetical protein
MPTSSETDVTILLKRAGFDLTPEQIAEYTEAYGYITEMAARIRNERSYVAEPAHIFSFPEEKARP